jgi:hypothetical protein
MADPIRLRLVTAIVDAFRVGNFPDVRRCVHDLPAPVENISKLELPAVFLYDPTESPDSPDENQATAVQFNFLDLGVAIYFDYGRSEAETILVVGNRLIAAAHAVIEGYGESADSLAFLIRPVRNEIAYMPCDKPNIGVAAMDYSVQYRHQRLDPTAQ